LKRKGKGLQKAQPCPYSGGSKPNWPSVEESPHEVEENEYDGNDDGTNPRHDEHWEERHEEVVERGRRFRRIVRTAHCITRSTDESPNQVAEKQVPGTDVNEHERTRNEILEDIPDECASARSQECFVEVDEFLHRTLLTVDQKALYLMPAQIKSVDSLGL
jgi:hypothetical protein